MPKKFIHKDVHTAAVERISYIIDNFEKFYVSFSGGKDSGLLLNMVIDIAKQRGRLPVNVLIVDFEAQYSRTVEHIYRMASKKEVKAYWVCLPIHLRNAVSQIQPHWLCWDPDKRDAWVREFPNHSTVINDESYFPFFRRGMEFEEFVPEFGEWFSGGKRTACLVAIRSDESLNRFRTIKNEKKETYHGKMWTTKVTEHVWNAYPVYDWRTEDIWIANGRFGYDYNRIYDLMHLAGLTIHQMRLCQPYGDDQRKGLWLFKILEPETWSRVVQRVEGANFGNRYSESQSHTLGNFKINLPEGHTYRSYAKFLLGTMPPYMAERYRKKILVFLKWWKKNGRAKHGISGPIPDYAESRLEASRKTPSWRRICKVLLKNDYWCKGLSFSQTKREMERQLALVAKYMEEEKE